MPAPCVIDGGGGLSTICGFGLLKREKKLAHISILFFIVNPYKFRFFGSIHGGDNFPATQNISV
jgi:hypothetical protein